MPDGVSPRVALLVVAFAFGLTFTVRALVSDGPSAAEPVAKASPSTFVADAPAVEPDLSLAAGGTVPALRQPRRPHKRRTHTRKVKRAIRRVTPAVRATPVMPAATAQPVATAAPRYVAPAPPTYTPPTPKPAAPKPAPTTAPPSGEFDTSGE